MCIRDRFSLDENFDPCELDRTFIATTDQSTLYSYEWDFDNDGTIDATGPIANYTFPTPGNYTVSLTVDGCETSEMEIIIELADDCISCCDEGFTTINATPSMTITEAFNLGLIDDPLSGNARQLCICLLYTSPSPRDLSTSRMPSSA